MWVLEWNESMKEKLKWLGIGALAFGVSLVAHRAFQVHRTKGKAKKVRTEPAASKKA